MNQVKNVLFIMADQLRWDYLSCYGHPHLHTPNIDRLAERGVRFDRAYASSPVCGPSRASFYTGRSVFSHGATWNTIPLPIGELTIGDYLKPLGYRTAVVGKTHMRPDRESMDRLGIDASTEIGVQIMSSGFEPYERDDGLHPTPLLRLRDSDLAYNEWLRGKGYDGENPWNDWANSAEGPDGEILSGWYLENSHLPARVKEEHSETAYMTDRAIDFMTEMGDDPWLLHLSYIKPHWPYMAPAPYHDMYQNSDSVLPALQSEAARDNAHEVYGAFMDMEVSQSFSNPEVRNKVVGTYMGLIKQIDDHLGRVFSWLEETGRDSDTMIVFTSDHGDYLGDHYLGEKELFHEMSVRIPLIVMDPRPEADSTRGTACDAVVEGIDLVPTFLDATGAPSQDQRVEGRSLQPLLHGAPVEGWREAAFSEIDYAFYGARDALKVDVAEARAYMVRTEHWKYVHFKGFDPQLFDLTEDPEEFHDLGREPGYERIRTEMLGLLTERLISRKNRVTMTNVAAAAVRGRENESGILIGRIAPDNAEDAADQAQ